MIILSRYKEFFSILGKIYRIPNTLTARFDTQTSFETKELRSKIVAYHSTGVALKLRSWNKL